MRPAPANGRVDPMPRRRGHEDIEAPPAVVPLLERRILDRDVAEGGEPLASERGQARTALDGGHRVPERCQRACRLTGTAAHLKHRGPPVHAGDGDKVGEQLVRVAWPHAVIELWHLVEHLTEVTSIGTCHRTNLPSAVAGRAGTSVVPASRRLPIGRLAAQFDLGGIKQAEQCLPGSPVDGKREGRPIQPSPRARPRPPCGRPRPSSPIHRARSSAASRVPAALEAVVRRLSYWRARCPRCSIGLCPG